MMGGPIMCLPRLACTPAAAVRPVADLAALGADADGTAHHCQFEVDGGALVQVTGQVHGLVHERLRQACDCIRISAARMGPDFVADVDYVRARGPDEQAVAAVPTQAARAGVGPGDRRCTSLASKPAMTIRKELPVRFIVSPARHGDAYVPNRPRPEHGSFQARSSGSPTLQAGRAGCGWPRARLEFIVKLDAAARAARSLGDAAMASTEKFEIDFDKLALEPMNDKITAVGAPSVPVKFHADTRNGRDRRLVADRRQELRFQADRRSGLDRRPKKTWEPGSNL